MSVTFKLNRANKALLINDSKVVKLKDKKDIDLVKVNKGDLFKLYQNFMKSVYTELPFAASWIARYLRGNTDESDPEYDLYKNILGLEEMKKIYTYLINNSKIARTEAKPLPKTEDLYVEAKEKYSNTKPKELNFDNSPLSTIALSDIENKYGTDSLMAFFSRFVYEIFDEMQEEKIEDGKLSLSNTLGISIPYELVSNEYKYNDLSHDYKYQMLMFKKAFVSALKEYLGKYGDEIASSSEDIAVFTNTIKNIVSTLTSGDLLKLLNNILMKAAGESVNTVRSQAEQEEIALKNVEKNQERSAKAQQKFAASQNASDKDIIGK